VGWSSPLFFSSLASRPGQDREREKEKVNISFPPFLLFFPFSFSLLSLAHIAAGPGMEFDGLNTHPPFPSFSSLARGAPRPRSRRSGGKRLFFFFFPPSFYDVST